MKLEFQHHSENISADLTREGENFILKILEKTLEGKILELSASTFSIQLPEKILRGFFFANGDCIDVHLPGGTFRIRFAKAARREGSTQGQGELRSPMPGKVIKLLVTSGAAVRKGDLLMILEAMKMEHKILSPGSGVVKKIHFAEGDRVSQAVELIEIEEEKKA
jgi:acetyl/propionyl-CoA carboxylase alpha subunit